MIIGILYRGDLNTRIFNSIRTAKDLVKSCNPYSKKAKSINLNRTEMIT